MENVPGCPGAYLIPSCLTCLLYTSQMGLQYGDTPAPSFEEDSFEEDSYEETENYPEYEEGYQEDGNGQE